MNILDPSVYPQLREEYLAAQNLSMRMSRKGHMVWELGPLCTRDYAWQLADLKKAVEAFMKTCQEPHGDLVCEVTKKEYRSAKQAVHSILNRKP